MSNAKHHLDMHTGVRRQKADSLATELAPTTRKKIRNTKLRWCHLAPFPSNSPSSSSSPSSLSSSPLLDPDVSGASLSSDEPSLPPLAPRLLLRVVLVLRLRPKLLIQLFRRFEPSTAPSLPEPSEPAPSWTNGSKQRRTPWTGHASSTPVGEVEERNDKNPAFTTAIDDIIVAF